VPLIKEDGISFKWCHKAMQDYYAAKFIYSDSNDKKASILSEMFESKNNSLFINIFDIYFDMDYQIFKQVIIRSWIKKYIDYYEGYLKTNNLSISRDTDLFLSSSYLKMEIELNNHVDFIAWFYRAKVKPNYAPEELKEIFSELGGHRMNYENCVLFLQKIDKEIEEKEQLGNIYEL
jgi:hypothetical protein